MVQTKFKDFLFRWLFDNAEHKEWALSLYNGANHSNYTNADDLIFITIGDFLYMGMKNDCAFIFQARMNVYEQQSTYNPNMPLRFVIYVGKLLDKYVHEHEVDLYSSSQQYFPKPMCVCFYNGTDKEVPDRFVLPFSDGFLENRKPKGTRRRKGKKPDTQKPKAPVSEDFPNVVVYNINKGHNADLMKACQVLSEYAWFVEEVRGNVASGMKLEDAIDKAVKDMPNDFILKNHFIAHLAEVKDMVQIEFDMDAELALRYKDGYNSGYDSGEDHKEMMMWISGVRAWAASNQPSARNLIISVLHISEDVFDEILEEIQDHPDYTDEEIAEVIGWT